MPDLKATLNSVLIGRYKTNAARIHELAAPLSESQFWQKAFPFGNSFGHLVLHLTGNLNYYIGAQIAQTGYVRDRSREFSESSPPAKREALEHFQEAVAMVIATIGKQSAEDWPKDYSATRTDCTNRLDIVVNCAAHMQHHIGQMIYIGYALERASSEPAR